MIMFEYLLEDIFKFKFLKDALLFLCVNWHVLNFEPNVNLKGGEDSRHGHNQTCPLINGGCILASDHEQRLTSV